MPEEAPEGEQKGQRPGVKQPTAMKRKANIRKSRKVRADKRKPGSLHRRVRHLLGGSIKVPVRKSGFGKYLDLDGLIPADANCIMVLLNSGGGLNAGWPKPIGFIKLTHQLYVEDLKELLEAQAKENPDFANTRWVTICPIRSSEYVDVWSA